MKIEKKKLLGAMTIVLLLVVCMVIVGCGADKPTTVTISYVDTDGSLLGEQIVQLGAEAPELKEPSKDGYVFIGWYCGGIEFNFETAIEADVTLIAQWQRRYLTVRFYSAGGSEVSTQEVEYGKKAICPQEPTQIGYDLIGWNTVGGELYDFSSPVYEDIVLIAVWEETITYATVSFDSAGGSAIPSQLVLLNGWAQRPADPVKTGYIFNGWLLDGATYNFNVPVVAGIILTADWKAIMLTVTFDSAGGSDVESQNVAYGSKLSIPKCEYVGFVLKGWMLPDATMWNFEDPVTQDMHLTALWEVQTFSVVFMANNEILYSTVVKYGELIENTPNPEMQFHVFKGWVSKDGTEYNFSTPVTSDIVLYAVFEYDINLAKAHYIAEIKDYKAQKAQPSYRYHYTYAAWTAITDICSEYELLISSAENEIEIVELASSAKAAMDEVKTIPQEMQAFMDALSVEEYWQEDWAEIIRLYEYACQVISEYEGGLPYPEKTANDFYKGVDNVFTKEEDIAQGELQKSVRIRELTNYVESLKEADYSTENWALVQNIYTQGIENLNNAIGTRAVGIAYAEAYNKINAVEVNYWTVTFMVGEDVYRIIKVTKNGYWELPEDPVSEGFVFCGWMYNDKIVDFNEFFIESDTVLVADFRLEFVVENGVLVEYNGKGGVVVIPEGVKEISAGKLAGANIFRYKNVTKVVLPTTLEKIHAIAFLGCDSLFDINFEDTKLSYIGEFAFQMSGLVDITFPATLAALGQAGQYGLCSVFKDCTKLTSVKFADNCALTQFGGYLFAECSALKYVEIPKNVNFIRTNAFLDCFSIQDITSLNPVPPTIEDVTVFTGVSENVTITVPVGSVDAYKNADSWKLFPNITSGEPIFTNYTIAFKNIDDKWATMYYYAYYIENGVEVPLTAFPGTPITEEMLGAKDYYYMQISSRYTHVVFTDGNNEKTSAFEIKDNYMYDNSVTVAIYPNFTIAFKNIDDKWATMYYYAYYIENGVEVPLTAFPGTPITEEMLGAKDYYYMQISSRYTHVVFTDGNNEKTSAFEIKDNYMYDNSVTVAIYPNFTIAFKNIDDKWTTMYYYAYYIENGVEVPLTAFPGTQITEEMLGAKDYYYMQISSRYTHVVFTDGNNEKTSAFEIKDNYMYDNSVTEPIHTNNSLSVFIFSPMACKQYVLGNKSPFMQY
ncbi:MAG: InlB B-repeat-containing protein [Clostridia bacterium]|nr:InlB B-repeat-containing protein [Clostridia bacterium]